MIIDVVKVLLPAVFSFFIGLAFAPIFIRLLHRYELWKKKPRTEALGGGDTPIFTELHKEKETGTPRLGGVIIWGSVLLTISLIWLLAYIFPTEMLQKLEFLSRNQTWLPLFTLIAASLIGLFDDLLVIFNRGGYIAGGIPLSWRIAMVVGIGLIGAWWFFTKLEVSAIVVPFLGAFDLGLFFIPFFVLVMLALFSGGVIDGIDGLAGGIMASIFAAYAGIAFFQNQIDLAAFSAVVTGGILAFLWFNVPPARFYMSETGILGLTTTLAVVAFLTNAVIPLVIIAAPLFITTASVVVQLLSKKLRGGKKIFLVAPLHHHFEAIGWPSYQVTMRFWIIGVILALLGVAITLVG